MVPVLKNRVGLRWSLLGVAAILFGVLPADALAYSCSSSHCYGTVAWNGMVDGADTRIRAASTYMNNGSHFISNEMWVMDFNGTSSSCSVDGYSSGGITWVEVAMLARGGQYPFFWAECKPGGYFNDYLFSVVPSGVYGTSPYFEIKRTASSTFRTRISASGYSATDYSYSNSMVPDRIRIGTELFGTSGGYSNQASWTHNRYIHGNSHYYQFRDGDSKVVNSPVQAWWQTVPASGNNGGDWRTQCGC